MLMQAIAKAQSLELKASAQRFFFWAIFHSKAIKINFEWKFGNILDEIIEWNRSIATKFKVVSLYFGWKYTHLDE